MTGAQLVEAARLAAIYGDGAVRLGVDQNFVLSGAADDRVGDLLAEPLLPTFSLDAGPSRVVSPRARATSSAATR